MENVALRRIASVAALAVALGAAPLGPASAGSDSCREWELEHARWKASSLRLALRGAPQPELDGALFEMLQREVYLTSCERSLDAARAERVGWRLVDRSPDEFGSAVLESVLEQGGFALDLRSRFDAPARRP